MGIEGVTESLNTTAVEDVAHLLVRCLEAEGVECVFGIPGEENIRFVDALNGSGIRYVLVRHEQAMSIPPSSPPSTRLGWCASPQRTACGYFTPR